jgi:outer membrane protein assembly factor BamB
MDTEAPTRVLGSQPQPPGRHECPMTASPQRAHARPMRSEPSVRRSGVRKHRMASRVSSVTGVVLAVLMLVSTGVTSVNAATSPTWPQLAFGPARNADNVSETVLSPATVGSMHQIWSAPGMQSGIMSPLVAGDGLLYVSFGMSDPTSLEGVHALNLTTGAPVWFYHFTPGSKFTPALSGNTLYVSTGSGLFALNALSGKVLWRSSAGGTFQAATSPLVANGSVYVISYGAAGIVLRALNAVTGAVQWTKPVASSLIGPLAYLLGVVYATTTLAANAPGVVVEAIRATDGRVLWSKTLADWSASYRPMVTLGEREGLAFVNGQRGVWALKLTDGSVAWHSSYPKGDTGDATLALDVTHDILISPEGSSLDAWRASTGAPLWKAATTLGGGPAIANGVVYDFSGVLNETTGAPLWAYPAGFGSIDQDGVAVTGGHLYVNGRASGSLTFDTFSFGLN